jgi:YggT family protein
MGFICALLWIYLIALLVRVLSSWFPPPRSGLLARIMGIIFDITEPVLRPLRNLLPPIRMGVMALDLSPIIVFIVIGILQNYLC